MTENQRIAIDKVVEEFRPKKDTLMLMMSAREYEYLVRDISRRAYEYGWEEGMADAPFAKKSKN